MLTSEPSDLAISSTWNALPSDLHKVIIYMAYHLHHLGLEKYNISSYRASVAVLSKIGPLLLSITPPITLFLIHDLLLCIFLLSAPPLKCELNECTYCLHFIYSHIPSADLLLNS